MKKTLIATVALAAALPAAVSAQSAIDAYTLSPTQLRGTARFVAMGGAFTSLGGDLSSMTQNPAGLGLYRKSDVGLTFDISMRATTATTSAEAIKQNFTKAVFDNIGYVGVVPLSGAMSSLQWGVSYNRINSFDRRFQSYNIPTGTSLSNYIASYTNGVPSGSMLFDKSQNYNPYLDSSNDWLSILAYQGMIINNTGSDTQYAGLYQNGTVGDALTEVRETGYTDEYNIDFAGNVNDIVFWGLGVGIVDQQYTRQVVYSESMENALIYDEPTDRLTTGNAGFELSNIKAISGTGVNLKFGVIVRPIEELRVGFAVHTPTWMSMNSQGNAVISGNYTPAGTSNTNSVSEYTEDFDYDWRMNSPWKFMIGASTVIGNKAILSVDYERVAYNDMSMKYASYTNFGQNFVVDQQGNEDIKNLCRAANIVRVGAEYRLTPSVSVRAGYNYQSSSASLAATDGRTEVYTAGTDPSYSFNTGTSNISIGLGYRYQNWYIDLAYVHTDSKAHFAPYTPFAGLDTPSASLSTKHNNIVVSTGIRF